MKNKRIFTVLICIIFAIGLIVSILSVFKIKQVRADFSVTFETKEEYMQDVQKTLNKYLKKSMLTVKESEVEKSLKNFTYLEVVSVKKEFPNVLKVKLKERKEVFLITSSSNDSYILNEEGFVLAKTDKTQFSQNEFVIMRGFEISSVTVGENIKPANLEIFNTSISLAKIAGYTDNVKSMTLSEFDGEYDILFETNTGVTITVQNILDDGVEKMDALWTYYDGLTDYEKSYKNLLVNKNQNGEIITTWTDKNA